MGFLSVFNSFSCYLLTLLFGSWFFFCCVIFSSYSVCLPWFCHGVDGSSFTSYTHTHLPTYLTFFLLCFFISFLYLSFAIVLFLFFSARIVLFSFLIIVSFACFFCATFIVWLLNNCVKVCLSVLVRTFAFTFVCKLTSLSSFVNFAFMDCWCFGSL